MGYETIETNLVSDVVTDVIAVVYPICYKSTSISGGKIVLV